MKRDIENVLLFDSEDNNDLPWENIEKKEGIVFPNDFKEFINRHGAGNINEFLWILSPFSDNPFLNSFVNVKNMKRSFDEMADLLPSKMELKIFEEGTGLFPWAITDNGDELYWNYNGSKQTIVVIASRYSEMQEYDMGMDEFLYKLLSNKISCNIFPSDFVSEKNYYHSI